MVQGGKVGVALKGKRLRRAAMAALMLTSSLGMVGVAAPAQAQEAARDFDIPAQPLANALTAFGQQSGLQVSAQAPLIEGRTSSAVRGALPPLQALSQLLTGTGLSFRIVGSTVTLEPAPQSAGGTIQLGPVRVEGEGSSAGSYGSITSDALASEGIPSYAAKASASVTRLPLSLRRTPQSVTVITRQQIEDQNLQSISDVLQQTPGISINRDNSEGFSFYSRGFAIQSFQFDGVPSLSSDGGNTRDNYSIADSVIYDRIEILKGATGLVSGSGYPSGVVNFIRKKPTYEWQAQASIGAGSWDNYRAELDMGGPLTQNGSVRARIVGAYQDKDSFIDYLSLEQKTIYGLIEADLTSSTLISIGADYQENDNTAATTGNLPAFYTDRSVVTFRRSTNAADKWAFRRQNTVRAFLGIEHGFGGDWVLKANGVYRRYESRELIAGMTNAPIDRTTGSGGHGNPSSRFNTDTTERGVDLMLSGKFNLLSAEDSVVIGYNFARTAAESNRYDGTSDASINDIFNWDNNATQPTTFRHGALIEVNAVQHIAYGTVVLHPTERLSLIAGGRFNWHRWNLDFTLPSLAITTRTGASVGGKFIPYLGATYDFDDHHTVYASFTDIFKPQAYNLSSAGRPLDPLTGKNYEIGLKGEYLDGQLNATIAAFIITQDNAPELDPSGATTPTGGVAYIGVEGVTTKGFEVELVGEPLPGLRFHGGYTYRRSRDRNDDRVSTIQPENLFKLATTYKLPGVLSGLSVGGDLHWQSGTYFETTVSGAVARFGQKAYLIAGLTAAYDVTDRITVSAALNNLFDKKYYSGIGQYNTVFYGNPRNFFVSLRGRF